MSTLRRRTEGAGARSSRAGIWTEKQVAGWKEVTSAVHAAGGLIVSQFWHVGRLSDPIFHAGDMRHEWPVVAARCPMHEGPFPVARKAAICGRRPGAPSHRYKKRKHDARDQTGVAPVQLSVRVFQVPAARIARTGC
ncbi:hypothetical protein [Paraburkholderia sp. MM6662-R1]|uniref:oxidoreductase n=1 Tax=Paraburkholderia sp. MM6662-R1 TaxID=2991066 RepID=UPI003D1A2B33